MQETIVSSTLDAVTVYASGALCRRKATVTPEGTGANARLRLTGLPLVLDAHSLRGALGLGPGSAGIRVIDVRREVRAEIVEPARLAALQQELDRAEEAHDAARARRDRLAARVDATAALRAVPPPTRRGDPPRPAPVEALLELAAFVDDRLTALHDRLLAAEDALSLADHELELARHRLAEASRALPTETTRTTADAVLTLSREPEAASGPWPELSLDLEYVVPGATWFPSYQLRLAGDGTADRAGERTGDLASSGVLALRAAVAQRTGEDWTGVRLALSTADLRRSTALPELRSIRLGRRQDEAPVPILREPPAGLAGLFEGYDQAERGRPHAWGPVAVAGAPSGGAAVAAAVLEGDTLGGAGVPLAAPPPPAPQAVGGPDRLMRGPARRAKSYAAPPFAQPAAFGAMAPSAAPMAPGAAVAMAPPAPPTPPAPSDYAALVLAGPDAEASERGTLAPERGAAGVGVAGGAGGAGGSAVETQYRHRAEAVASLRVPQHAVPVGVAAPLSVRASFAHRFDAAAPVDVPADGAWHSIAVTEVPVELTLRHLCVPALDPRVYAAVELRNTSPHPLLPGPVDVLLGGEYTATVPMPALARGESRHVGIGVEEGVRVARRTRTSESTAGLRGGTSVVARGVEIDVVNRLGRAVELEVLERVPVSDEKDVRVEETEATPPWTVVPPEEDEQRRRGLRRWRIELEPGGSAALRAGHQIRLPADKAVVGGNRRDA